MRGRQLTEKWKANISVGCTGKKGRVLTAEQSAAMFAKRKPMTAENKAIAAATCKARSKTVTNLDTGQTFASATEAAKSLGVHPVSIRDACRGKLQKVGGHRWSYIP
jgi:hypothetical protein